MNGILYITGALADGGVTTAKIADGAVTNGKLATDAITTAKISNSAVTNSKLGDDSVTGSRIADNAVATEHITNGSVTAVKLASGVQTTINNNADNRVITGSGTANTLNGEANITFSGSTLGLSAGAARRVGVKDQTSSGNGGNLLVCAGSAHTAGTTAGDLLLATSRGISSGPTGTIKLGYNDGSNGLGLDQEWMRIDSSGRLLIGFASDLSGGDTSTLLQVTHAGGGTLRLVRDDTSIASGDNLGRIHFSGRDGSASVACGAIIGKAIGTHTTTSRPTAIIFNTTASGSATPTERVRIQEEGGISFNGDTAAANALDDYEEGTFTPRIQTSNGNWGGGYSSQDGSYTKIGNVVHVRFRIHWSSVSGSGSFRVTALPFTVANTGSNEGGGSTIGVRSGFNYQVLSSFFRLNTQLMQMQFVDGSGSRASFDLSVGAIASTGYLYCSGWYEAA